MIGSPFQFTGFGSASTTSVPHFALAGAEARGCLAADLGPENGRLKASAMARVDQALIPSDDANRGGAAVDLKVGVALEKIAGTPINLEYGYESTSTLVKSDIGNLPSTSMETNGHMHTISVGAAF